MIRLIALFFLLTTLVSSSQEYINLSKTTNKVSDFKTKIFEDKSAQLEFEDILKNKNFVDASNKISQGYTSSVYWIYFGVKNKDKKKLKYFINLSAAYLDKVDCYIVSEDGDIKHSKEGIGYFKSGQNTALKKPSFELLLKPDQHKDIYLKISSQYPVFTSLNIYTKEAMYKQNNTINIFYALYFGAVLALILYNFFIYMFIRDRAYMFYILFAISFVSWQLILNAFYPFNSFSSSSSFYVFSSFIPMSMGFLFYFSRDILETKKYFSKTDRLIKIVANFYFVLAFGSMFNFNLFVHIMNATTSLSLPLLLYIGYLSYKRGNKTALYYLIAQLSFITTATLFSLSAFGILEYSEFNRHGLILGSFFEIILFSLALAYKIKSLEREKFLIIQRNNIELDAKVKERTQELEQSKLQYQELATKDVLTGLLNRRALDEISKNLIKKSKKENTPLSVVLFDIDKFKSINDTYGHIAGDKVLVTFSTILKSIIDCDVIARIGGEEFALMLANTDKQDAYEVAQKIRNSCQNTKVDIGINQMVSITISGGIATLAEDDATIYDLINRADKLMYRAKEEGRNRVLM